MKNPHEHIPFCQASSAIAAHCPVCAWVLLQQSQLLPEPKCETKLTLEDEKFLAELAISY